MNIWKSLADKFDNLLPRTTAVFVKETDYSLGITYPLEEMQTAFNFIFSDNSTYDLPPKFTFYFGAYENTKEVIRLKKNRPLFTKCISYPGLIRRELNYSNIGLAGVERMGQRKNGALTLHYDLTCINPSDDFHNNLYSILKSQEVFKASVKNGVITLKFKDMKYYISSNTQMEVGLYADEFSMLKDLETDVKLNKQGHFLVIKQKFSVLPKEKLDISFGFSSISGKNAVNGTETKNYEKLIAKRYNDWFKTLPSIEFNSKKEFIAYYKSWAVIRANYLNHKDWGFNITECLPVYKGIWQWAISSVEWHNSQDGAHLCEWIKKALDMFFTYQREDGYITHAIYIDEKIPGEGWANFSGIGIIQTPHLAWTALRYYNASMDVDSLKKWYAPLKKYYDYICRTRDEENRHLWAITCSWDTGLDTTCAFQRVTYGENGVKEDYCYPAIFGAERIRFEIAMGKIAEIIGESSKEWYEESQKTVNACDYLWDDDKKWYGVRHQDGTLDTRVGIDGLFFLAYGLISQERANLMRGNFEKLIAKYGVRTVAPDENGFSADAYWRGACWSKSASLGMQSAKYYYPDLATKIANANVDIVNKHTSIWECWNGDTGIYSRGDGGLICTPGMSSNVGAGDVIGTILTSHGVNMYSIDGIIPLIPIKNYHISGMLISIEKADNCYLLSANKAEKDEGIISIDNGEKIVKVFIKDGEKIVL